jgi:hypothetical protein
MVNHDAFPLPLQIFEHQTPMAVLSGWLAAKEHGLSFETLFVER